MSDMKADDEYTLNLPGQEIIVYYRRRTGERRILRKGEHHKPDNISEKEYRLRLISDYNRTNKRVERITTPGTTET